MSIEWGEPIEVNGERPEWLADSDYLEWKNAQGMVCSISAVGLEWGKGMRHQIETIRLPADHWYYTVARWNSAHPDQVPFTPWGGGDTPAFGSEGDVLLRNGVIHEGLYGWRWTHHTHMDEYDIIGYRKKAAQQTDAGDEYVSIKRRTAEEWEDYIKTYDRRGMVHSERELLAQLGLIIKREPTEAERIAHHTGVALDIVEAVLKARGV